MVIRDAAARLSAAGIDTPRLDAEVLLRHALGIDRAQLFARLRDPVVADIAARFARLIERRLAGEPVAYLTGEREFMGLPFAVGPGVLVPRPETEWLVEWAATWLAHRQDLTVVDTGTGSGAIAVSLAASIDPALGHRVLAVDTSPAALAFALRNTDRLAPGRVTLVQGDLAAWLAAADLVLANLPYLTPDQMAGNPDLAAEPGQALVSGPDGLDAIRRLVADLPRLLNSGGAAAFELDPTQAATVADAIGSTLPDASVTIQSDLAGLDRFVIAQRG